MTDRGRMEHSVLVNSNVALSRESGPCGNELDMRFLTADFKFKYLLILRQAHTSSSRTVWLHWPLSTALATSINLTARKTLYLISEQLNYPLL